MIFFTESVSSLRLDSLYTIRCLGQLSRTIMSWMLKKNQTLDLASTSTTSRPYSHRSGPLCPAYIRAYFSVLETFETQLG